MASDFDSKYNELEKRFKAQVKKDNEIWKCEYLPNPIRPKNQVDYILIGMEPSLGGWTDGNTEDERLKIAGEKIRKGFKNFALTIEDFIVHSCVRNYLCSKSEKYYITDLSKGAMLTDKAVNGRNIRYQTWYNLLIDEIDLVTKKEAKIIAIGKSVNDFLIEGQFQLKTGRKQYFIPHYSSQASWYWDKVITDAGIEINQRNIFYSSLCIDEILKVANDVLTQLIMDDDLKKEIFNALPKELTESKKKLILCYKTLFEQIISNANSQK
jgi:hypothetical protein